ncbi:hypothetical protein ACFCY8_10490 [Streptomyces noursei]|uniref:hypothetical protein n=1 Tax=Streptomyces noursei TaxID=1971 RepID=UPI0035E13C65
MTNDETDTATVQPAAAWPSYEEDHAQAELAALRMLVAKASLSSVRQRTGLSWAHIYRLATLVNEEARDPAVPRNVLRDPRPRRPARIQVVEPHQESLPEPADTDGAPASKGTVTGPPETQPEPPATSPAEPEQLSLMCV